MTCDGIAGGIGGHKSIGADYTTSIKNDDDDNTKRKFATTDQALAANSAFVAWGHATQSGDNSNTGGGYYS